MDQDTNNCISNQSICKACRVFIDENSFYKRVSEFDKTAFMPGIRKNPIIIDTHDFKYLKSGKFKANLHVHSINSDGLNSVKKLLNHANAIAERNFKNYGNDFIFSITDHDTLDGAKEVYKIVSQKPEKFKHLKIALGLEISALGNSFKNQTKPVTLHTLCYCINPFDKKLNEFIDRKKKLKLKLMHETIQKLNKELAPVLSDLGITFSVEEAAKIHEMVLKGQDEICRPLIKYTTAKILFTYYTKNLPKKELLSYEKPVQLYKEFFRQKDFQESYADTLEKYLSLNSEAKFKLWNLPQYLKDTILVAKNICQNSHPTMTEMPEAFSSFEETLKMLSTLENGLICVAHPARIEINHIDGNPADFYNELFKKFKQLGKDKALFYEGHYQSYEGNTYLSLLPIIDRAAEKHKLLSTGGMDSHGPDVITRCPYS